MTSSSRAPHQPNRRYRGVLYPTIESIVLTTLNSTSPGSPAKHVPEHRADEAVRQVLAQAFDGRPPAGGAVHAIGVAADERATAARARGRSPSRTAARSARRGAADRPAPAGCRAETRGVARPRSKRLRRMATPSAITHRQRRHRERDEEQDAAAISVEAARAEPLLEPSQQLVRPVAPDATHRPDRQSRDRRRRRSAQQVRDRARAPPRVRSDPVRHFSDHPSASARSTSVFTSPFGVWPQRRAELAPSDALAPPDWPRALAACCTIARAATASGMVP